MMSHKEKDPSVIFTRRGSVPLSSHDLLHVCTLLLNRWEIYTKLGDGLHGEVYCAYDRQVKQDVAIKVYKNAKRFHDEVRIMKKMSNLQHFCRYIHDEEHFATPFIVMDLKGPTLREIINYYRPLCASTVANLTLQLLDAIETMHNQGYLHGDIKPGNIVMGMPPHDTNDVCIVDFSLSREYDVFSHLKEENKGYAPLYCFAEKVTKCRCDDIYKILYVLIETRVDVPWAQAREERDFTRVQYIKQKTTDTLVKHYLGREFIDFKAHLDNLSIYDPPDYDMLRTCVYKLVHRRSLDLCKYTEWERNPLKIWEMTRLNSPIRHSYDIISKTISAVAYKPKDFDEKLQLSPEQSKRMPSKSSDHTSLSMLPLLPIPDDLCKITRSKTLRYPQKPYVTHFKVPEYRYDAVFQQTNCRKSKSMSSVLDFPQIPNKQKGFKPKYNTSQVLSPQLASFFDMSHNDYENRRMSATYYHLADTDRPGPSGIDKQSIKEQMGNKYGDAEEK